MSTIKCRTALAVVKRKPLNDLRPTNSRPRNLFPKHKHHPQLSGDMMQGDDEPMPFSGGGPDTG